MSQKLQWQPLPAQYWVSSDHGGSWWAPPASGVWSWLCCPHQSGRWVSHPGCPRGLTHFLEPSPLFSLDHFLSYQAGVLLQVYPQSPRISLCLVAKLAQTQLSTPFRRGSLTCDPQPLLPLHPQTASPGLCPLAAHYLPHIQASPFSPGPSSPTSSLQPFL